MTKTAIRFEPVNPNAWTLRDEMAMRLAAALVVKGGWIDGAGNPIKDMRTISEAGYQFADHMLRARGVARDGA